jgi:hypothetical protein
MSLGDAERQLATAKAHLKVIAEAGSHEQLRAAWPDITDAEREVARLRGEQYASRSMSGCPGTKVRRNRTSLPPPDMRL